MPTRPSLDAQAHPHPKLSFLIASDPNTLLSILLLGVPDFRSVWEWQEPGWPVRSCPWCLDHSSRILGHAHLPQILSVRSPSPTCPASQSLSLSTPPPTHRTESFTTASSLPIRAVGTDISLSYLVCPRMSRRARCIVGTRYIFVKQNGCSFCLGS